MTKSRRYVSLLLKLTFTAPKLVSTLGTGRLYGLDVNKTMHVLGIKHCKAHVHRGHYRSSRFSVVRPILTVSLKLRNTVNNGKICTNRQISNKYGIAVLIYKSCLVYITKGNAEGYVSRDLCVLKEIHCVISRISGER